MKSLIVCLACLTFALTLKAKECAVPEEWQKVSLNEDALTIAVLRINKRPVTDSIDLYEYQDTFLLPISQLGFLLGLPWEFTPETNNFASDFDKPKYTKIRDNLCSFDFRLNNSVNTNTEATPWYTDDFDTYIDVHAVASLLQGEAEFNVELQQLNFTSTEASLGLKSSGSNSVNAYYNEVDITAYPIVKDEYKLFTSPIVNYRINVNSDRSQSKLKFKGNVNANFDLLGLASEYRLNSNSTKTTQFLKFSKNISAFGDKETELGNIQSINDRALKYEAGDITLLGDELIFPTKQVLGVNTYSYSQNQRRNFSNIQIEETALPGWRATLFRNGQFIAEQTVDEKNRITFKDVATFIGVNRFRINLFGPQGQEQIKEQVVHVGQNQRQHKQFDFQFSASDASRTLFAAGNNDTNPYNHQVSASASYGVTKRMTVEVEWHELIDQPQKSSNTDTNSPSSDKAANRYITTSVDYANWQSLFRTQFVRHSSIDGKHGQALFFGVNSNINRFFNGNLTVKYLDDFISQKHTSAQGLTHEVRGRINGRIQVPIKMGLGFNFSEQRFKDQAVRRALSVNTSQNVMGSTFSNTFQYKSQRGDNTFSHRMYLSHNIGRWQFSQSLTWTPFDGSNVTSYSANLRWPQQATTFNETRLDYNKGRSAELKLSHRFSLRTDFFNLSMGGSVDDRGNWTASLGISGSFYKNRQSGDYNFTQAKGNNARRIEAIAFIDNNRDGAVSENDDMIESVTFNGVATWSDELTNEDGAVQLFTVADYQSISIEETSLPDPFLAPSKPVQIVSTHAGGSNRVYFALLPVNDIEGLVIVNKNGKEKGLLGLTVRIKDTVSEAYWETQTESDGYFFVGQIPPGKYTVEIDQEHLDRLGLTQTKLIEIDAPDYGDVVTMDAIELIPSTSQITATTVAP